MRSHRATGQSLSWRAVCFILVISFFSSVTLVAASVNSPVGVASTGGTRGIGVFAFDK